MEMEKVEHVKAERKMLIFFKSFEVSDVFKSCVRVRKSEDILNWRRENVDEI